MIAQNDDTQFGQKGHQLLILLDSEDTHRGDDFQSTFLPKFLLECAHVFDTVLLLIITLKPNLTIGVSRGQSLQEAGRAVPM